MELILAFALAGVLLTYLPGVVVRSRACADLRAASRGRLALTFDDGPGASLEPKLLELLERHGAKATFFLLGCRADAAPARCDALVRAGHEVGCHGYGHVDAWRSTPWRAISDIRKGFAALAPWIRDSGLFRPAFGKLTLWTWIELACRRGRIAYWTHDSGDTHATRPSAERVASAVGEDGGGVVLLHSFDRRDPGGAAEQFVLDATESLLLLARKRDWQVCTVSTLMTGRRAERRS